jgi:hypothetical protein
MNNKVTISLFAVLLCLVAALFASTIYFSLKPLPIEAPPVQKQALFTPHDDGSSYCEIGSVNKSDLREAIFFYLFHKCPSLYGPDCAFIIKDDSKESGVNNLLVALTYENHKMLPYSKQLFSEKDLCYHDPDIGTPAMLYYITSINEVSPLDAIITCGCYANGKASLQYVGLKAHKYNGSWQFWHSGLKSTS